MLKLFTTQDVADRCDRSRQWVHDQIDAETIKPFARASNGMWFFRKKELETIATISEELPRTVRKKSEDSGFSYVYHLGD